MLSRVLFSLIFALLVAQPARALVVGGFDLSRGGIASIEGGSFYAGLRGAIQGAFPGVQISGAPVLGSAYLATLDVLMIASARDATAAIVPLSTVEQAAVLAFVQAGGAAIIVTDNDSFSATADLANESLLDPFGLDATGTTVVPTVTVTNPSIHPVTNGPFGLVSSYSTVVPGWLDGLGIASVLATLDANSQPTLAVIDAGALGSGSGPVVFLSDSVFDNDLILNSIALVQSKVPVLNPVGLVALIVLCACGAGWVARSEAARGPAK